MLTNDRGEKLKLDDVLAGRLVHAFIRNGYLDEDYQLTDAYFEAVESRSLNLPEELRGFQAPLAELLLAVYAEGKTSLSENARHNVSSGINQNFHRQEFQKLWNQINRKSVYTVKFDSDELVRKCIWALDTQLQVPGIRFTVRHGELGRIQSKEQLEAGEAFETRESRTEFAEGQPEFKVKYDLIGKLMDETKLTRKTIVAILTGIKESTFLQFRKNPEEFMLRAAGLINEQKAAMIIESITYDLLNDRFDAAIFTQNTLSGKLGENAIQVKKHIYDIVVTDSKVEREFARELDANEEVLVYAKLPRGFYIPTPLGKYNPDWAIVFREGDVKYIYFIAETKGTMESLELREVEKAKIECARKHFAKLNTARLKYDVVDSYEKLLEIVKS